jgi:hypothetical protein
LWGSIFYMYLLVACSLRLLDDDFDPTSSEGFFQYFDLARGVPSLCHDTALYCVLKLRLFAFQSLKKRTRNWIKFLVD